MRSRAILLALLVAGCTAPREKDCKAILPILDDALPGRTFALADGGLSETRFADAPRRTIEAIGKTTLHDPAVKDATGRLASATERYAAAMGALDELIAGLKLRAATTQELSGVSRSIDEARPPVEALFGRCGAGATMIDERQREECLALRRALEKCVSPERDDTTAEELLHTCAAAIEAVPTEGPATQSALARIARAVRAIEPFARDVGAPAKEVILASTRLAPKINLHTSARAEAEKAEADLRAICQP